MASPLQPNRFPGESPSYREARNQLLEAEMTLRKNLEEVATLRRKLPLGGEVPEDYIFDEGATDLEDSATARRTRLSELFQPGKDTLAIYSFMYGPKMKAACPACTSILDSLNGAAPHATQRINLAVVARNPIEKIRAHARARGWRNLRLLSSAGNTYNHDYHGETAEGDQTPGLNVFARRDGKIHHFYYTELRFVPPEPGQDHRHVDLLWPLWNLFDFTPEGRGTNWSPKLTYP
jgi:predicted dithiol-disulfide oxidoreductase (DUF899 family)